jgi:uncharacterized protein
MAQKAKLSEARYDIAIDKDVDIPMRDGMRLKADVFRPKDGGRFPPVLGISVYPKDKLWIPPPDLEEAPNPHMTWETPNPLWWVPRGYVLVRIDTRGSGKSLGMADPWSAQEAVDFYDAIEWAARQAWSNGNVGALGISYYAMTQWLVASLQPPSLKAIIPWEGAADGYRDIAYHGGIFSFGFLTNWYNTHTAHHLLGRMHDANPDAFHDNWLWKQMRHSLDAGWYDGRRPDWRKVTTPLYSVGNWSGMSLHLRGNTEGYTQSASPHKKLRIHCGDHVRAFYTEEGRIDQLRFFDHWLKGIDTGIIDEPPVKLLIRTGGGGLKDYEFRFENEWPIARTQWTKFYLHPTASGDAQSGAIHGRLVTEPTSKASALSYSASGSSKAGVASSSSTMLAAGSLELGGVSFQTDPLAADLEITGPVSLTLWVASTSEDMDIFATIRNVDPAGKDVWEIGQQGQQVPVAKGCLRASHRKLDPQRSLPYRPYHVHDERQHLEPGEAVEVQVEIWPTCMVFKKGHRLRLDITPRDGVGSAPYTHYHADYNIGAVNTIFAGGDKPSHLLLPVIPR